MNRLKIGPIGMTGRRAAATAAAVHVHMKEFAAVEGPPLLTQTLEMISSQRRGAPPPILLLAILSRGKVYAPAHSTAGDLFVRERRAPTPSSAGGLVMRKWHSPTPSTPLE